MTIKIRPHFETNSSSSHCLSWDGKTVTLGTLPVNAQGEVVINPECKQFGWGYEEFWDVETKAYYALLSLPEQAEATIKKHTGASKVIWDPSDSYIDHQSDGMLEMEYPHVDLQQFIFNTEIGLIISNDNDGPFPRSVYPDIDTYKNIRGEN